jgi:hypothetical protein
MHYQLTIEETPGGIPVSARLPKHIDHFSVLVDRTPQIVLLVRIFTKTSSRKEVSP